MSTRSILLGGLAALVAVGGIFLLIEVRSSGASAPTENVVAEAIERPEGGSAKPSPPPQVEDLNAGSARPAASKVKPAMPTSIDRRIAEKLNQDKAATDAPDPAVNPDFDAAMLEANKLYDRHNYDDARQLALKLLEREPGTVRMLRVVVSSSCILGDGETAQKYWTQLPGFDRNQMATRCERFGVTFTP
jgi:hypothetical protein